MARERLPVHATRLARWLIGMLVVRAPSGVREKRSIVRIVETEAYLPDDAASHAFGGPTARNAAMYLERGHAYVYFIYGMHFCLNVTADSPGVGAAVLIRAASIVCGEATMRARSGTRIASADLLRGPGRLARALAIDRTFDTVDLCADGPLYLASDPHAVVRPVVAASRRIGLTKNVDAPLRFCERGHPALSGPKYLAAKNADRRAPAKISR